MLAKLYVENLAVIKKVEIDFKNGMNLFTGETGAGKSVLMNAISLVVGGRCSKDMVRFSEKKATIIANFENISSNILGKIKTFYEGILGSSLKIERTIFHDGKSTAKINDLLVNVSILKKIGVFLVDICGQNSNQMLMNSENYLDILDEYGNLEECCKKYRDSFLKLTKINRNIKQINVSELESLKKIEENEKIINEIEECKIKNGEDLKLENYLKSAKNSVKILENLNLAHEILSGNDETIGAIDLLSNAKNCLKIAANYFSEIESFFEKINEIEVELKELNYDILERCENFDFNSKKFEEIEARLSIVNKIKRKYGPTIPDVLEKLLNLKAETSKLGSFKTNKAELLNLQKIEIENFKKIAKELSVKRKLAAETFSESVLKELLFLDMKEARFEVNVVPCKATVNGLETVEFLISANKGEPKKPMEKIASGGELSRILLSIKNVLAKNFEVETLIFDEIDTGVSGVAAQKIGIKLRQSSKNRQVICVTHTAQIAALADEHFKISKQILNNKTETKVFSLSKSEKIRELARIMAADSITSSTLKVAEELIEMGKRY